MELQSTSSAGNGQAVLASAVAWAEKYFPPEDLPEWVFQGEIALAQGSGIKVEQGEC